MQMTGNQEEEAPKELGVEIPYNFNPLAYLIMNPDVYRRNANPFDHYRKHGKAERRKYAFQEPSHKISLVCIMKREERFLIEWVAHHRNEGFRRIIIGDNGGSDEQTEMLRKLDALGIIRRVDLLGKERAQIGFYDQILSETSDSNEIIGFIDADEFLWSAVPDACAASLVSEIFSDPTVGALGVNWAIYGSNGNTEATNELVQVRFPKRAKQDFGPNHHVKSFVRGSASTQFAGNPHAVALKSGYRYVNSNKAEIVWGPSGAAISKDVVWGCVRLNHYVVKSRQEHAIRSVRGSATTAKYDTVKQSESYFKSYDRNEINDPISDLRRMAVKAEVEHLSLRMDLIDRNDLESGISRIRKTAVQAEIDLNSSLTTKRVDHSSALAPNKTSWHEQPRYPVPEFYVRGYDLFAEWSRLQPPYLPMVAFDVGANVGQTTLAIKKAFPDCVVYSFEAVSATFDRLSSICQGIQGVKLFNFALSDRIGNAHIENTAGSVNNGIVSHEQEGTEVVKCMTGDEFCKRNGVSRVDYLKIDTEGHDLAALRGFRQVLEAAQVSFFEVEVGMTRLNKKHVYFEDVLAFTSSLETRYDLFGIYEQVRETAFGSPLRRSNFVFKQRDAALKG